MKVITSLAPKNFEIQNKSVKSWIDLGFEVYSINTPAEISLLNKYDVNWITAKETATELYGSSISYPNLLEILSFCFSQNSPTWIINSDVYLQASVEQVQLIQEQALKGLVFGHRVEMPENKPYIDGFDWFVLHNNFKHIITTRNKLCIGQPFWDYWLPISFIRKGVSTFLCEDYIAYHTSHDTNWNSEQLYMFGKMVASEMGIKLNSRQDIDKFTYHCNYAIKENSIKWTTKN